MPLSQQKFREIVFQILYSMDVGHPDETLILNLMMEELSVSKKNVREAQEKVALIQSKQDEVDRLITSVSSSYDFDRIQVVTKNILRLGVFELLFDEQIPPKVAIAEAIRLSRKFNTPESASFVNALLDHLYKQSLGEKADTRQLANQSEAFLKSEAIAAEAAKEKLKQNNEH